MSTSQDSVAPVEHLWWSAADDAYFEWDGHTPEGDAATTTSLVSVAGTRREVDVGRFARLPVDAVTAALLPTMTAALGRIGKALAALDPAFDRGWDLQDLAARGAELDVVAAARRLIARVQAAPGDAQAALTTIVEDVDTLRCVLGFGSIAGPLIEAFAASRGASGSELSPEPAESPDAMVARVRGDVRAELDALAASRPPMSFDFQELTRPAKA